MIIDPGESNPHEEPCLACGEETAIGSVFFSDRHAGELPDGSRAFLCSECLAKARSVAGLERDCDTGALHSAASVYMMSYIS
jgi:hypothetical protein